MATSQAPTTIVWLRQDLRLDDNPALEAACQRRGPIIPVFIWSPEEEGAWPIGSASRWWLHQSLSQLADDLAANGSRLIVRRGNTAKELDRLIADTGADCVVWNRRYEPAAVQVAADIKARLRERGVSAESFNSGLLFEPWQVQTRQGKPFQVFTAFWRACLALPEPSPPRQLQKKLPSPRRWPESVALPALELEPKIDWAAGMRAAWQPGERGGRERLRRFVADILEGYATTRDLPALEGTSALSPHLHFGELSPRRVWHEVRSAATPGGRNISKQVDAYLRELGWRDFAHHLLYHFPRTMDQPLREDFARFPWREDKQALRAWQRGQTGYPLVDAGMRQLWATGCMHNRVRMVVASFLVKHLLLPWQAGAKWFWDTLVDADLANNTLGWQWTAGCGADAAPYFRVFNPILQGEKFDPEGDYVRRWVPELARLSAGWIHQPWATPAEILKKAGVELGRMYPYPIIEHAAGRQRALAAYESLRNPGNQSG